ncbi:MAG: DUF1189 domain-containing protein [Chitinispirillales bacterium]|nr:DUF1189 domain-containing protein [Chitinispirillales bacterium]
MAFFSDLHRAIFDARFYREAIGRSWGRVALFMVKLLVLTSLVSGFAKAYYFVHSERGIATLVGALFGDMEIRDGRLLTNRDQPYTISGNALATLMDRLAGYSRFFDRLPDNFLVVDTRTPPEPYAIGLSAPAVVLKEATVEFVNMRIEVPYAALIGKKNLKLTTEAVQEYLDANKGYAAAHFIIISLFLGFFSITLSAVFLSLAAYIFSTDRSGGYGFFLRIACYSVTPVTLGAALVSLSGVSAEWTWHIFIVISTIIMFRAMANSTLDKASGEKSEAQP